MTGISKLFFATGALMALGGMIWGIQMSASHDHTLAPAHGHLNLLGFVAMSVFGAYYALVPVAAAKALAKAHYVLALGSVILLAPGIALAVTDQGEALAKIGSILAVVSMGLFTFIVLRHPVPERTA